MTPPDVEGMLRRVVLNLFDRDVEAVWDTEPRSAHIHRVALTAQRGADRRRVGIRAATTGFFDLTVLDLDVSTTLLEYDDESYMEAILRELAMVADAYLRGGGRVEQKRGLFRSRPVLTITVNGKEWALGWRKSTCHYPEGTSTGRSDS